MKPPSTVLALLLILAATTASASFPRPVDIAAQPLDRALSAFSMQSGVQVLFVFASDKIRDAPAVRGNLTPEAALEQLLAGTDLQYQFVDDRTAVIQKRPPALDGTYETAPSQPEDVPVTPVAAAEVNSVNGGDFDVAHWAATFAEKLAVSVVFGTPTAVYNVMLLLGALVATAWLLLPAAVIWKERKFLLMLWVIRTRLPEHYAREELRELLAHYKARIREERPRSWLSGCLQSVVKRLRGKKRNDKPDDE